MTPEKRAAAIQRLHEYECEHSSEDGNECPGPSLWDEERVDAIIEVLK